MKTGSAFRWIGRLWSLASLALVVSFAAGSRETPSASEAVGLALFPGGVAVGMLVAWWREGVGGALTVASLLAFYAWSFLRDGRIPHGPWFLLIAAPGFMFLLAATWDGARSDPAA